MSKNGGFVNLVLIFLFAIAIISILVFSIFKGGEKTYNNQSQFIEPRITNYPTETKVIKDWDIPNLPGGFNWQTKSLDKDEAGDYRMFWSPTGKDNSYGDISFSTTLYFSDLNYDDPKKILDYHHGFIKEFAQEMESKGWTYDVNYGNKRIAGIAADGVFGSKYGTVKIIGDQIRSVGYSYDLNPASWEGPGSDIVCPCVLHLEIFVGDEVNLENI